ncbi:MAG: TatD family hydrolase [Gammaproteobacteria bacterium]|nr:TatD family hydrolase [Gammaproteobacteria bacterium]
MSLIDSHCHLDDDRFDKNRAAIIERAKAHGVECIVMPATTANRWDKIRQIAAQYHNVYAAYGLHPMFVEQHQARHLQELDEWLDREKPIAVGECGLDFFHGRTDEKWQLQLFIEQLQLAKNHHLPVIVHVRKAMDQVISLIRQYRPAAGVIHSFAGSLQQAQQLRDLNFKLGIAATVDFERAKKLRDVVTKIDEQGLLLESDAPDQAGARHRGELNEPAFIVEHFKTMACLRATTEQHLSAALRLNSISLFKLPEN